MNLNKTTKIYIAVLEEEQRISLTSSQLITRAKRIYDLNERERHRPIVRELNDLTDPYSG